MDDKKNKLCRRWGGVMRQYADRFTVFREELKLEPECHSHICMAKLEMESR